ncbi:MAG: lysophospholipid acyltransferase family protein [Chlorobiales bacterium]|nr:lysophospholipid acyltransferase family protein [Chlorobiales bacterium]
MKQYSEGLFKPLPLLPRGRAMLLRLLMLPNFLLTRAYGLENLPRANSASIYAFNHNNSLEVLMVPALLMYHLGGGSISFVIDWMYGKVPILGSVMNMTAPVYVYHKRSIVPWIEAKRHAEPLDDAIKQCTEKLRAGSNIGIFPEGKRNRNPEYLLKGKPGIGHIALKSGAAVVPVGIDFAGRISKGKIPVFGRMTVRIGKPIRFTQQSDAYKALMHDSYRCIRQKAELHTLANDVTREIMLCLAELSGKRYGESHSVMQNSLLMCNHKS